MCRISDKVIDALLQKGRIYEVGGAVRDALLDRNLPIKDRDYLVCGIPYSDLSNILRKFGEVDLVGKSFGVVKFAQKRNNKKFTFDIALPRREYSTGVGHKDFSVSFDPDLKIEDDLRRRDFTINAMAMALDSTGLIDPLDGQLDLKKRLIRMVTPDSFREDPLRMLRAIQFAARFNFEIEEKTYAAIKEHVSLIETVSAERVMEEFNKLLTLSEEPSIGFRLMRETGLLKLLLPEVAEMIDVDQPGGYHKYDVFEHTMHTIDSAPPILNIRLAALFHDIAKPRTRRVEKHKATFYGHEAIGGRVAARIMRRFRYSNELIHQVRTLVERHMYTAPKTDKGLRRLIRRVGETLIFDLLDLRRADIVAQGMGGTGEDVGQFETEIRMELEKRPPFNVTDLDINGREIMDMFNLPESRLVGEILDHLMEKVLDDPSENNREKLLEYVGLYINEKNKNGENI